MKKYVTTYDHRPPPKAGFKVVEIWEVEDDCHQGWVSMYLKRDPVDMLFAENDDIAESDMIFDEDY